MSKAPTGGGKSHAGQSRECLDPRRGNGTEVAEALGLSCSSFYP